MKAKFSSTEFSFKYDNDMSSSMCLEKEYVVQVCEFALNELLLQLVLTIDILIVRAWEVVARVEVPGGCTLEKTLLLPGFHPQTFPFILDYSTISDSMAKLYRKKSDSFDLICLEPARREPLIKGSA